MQISRLILINETPLCLFHFLQNQLTSNLTQNLRNCGPPLDQIELDPQDHKQGIQRAIERHVHSSPTHSNKLVNLNLKSWSFDVSISRQLFHFFFLRSVNSAHTRCLPQFWWMAGPRFNSSTGYFFISQISTFNSRQLCHRQFSERKMDFWSKVQIFFKKKNLQKKF